MPSNKIRRVTKQQMMESQRKSIEHTNTLLALAKRDDIEFLRLVKPTDWEKLISEKYRLLDLLFFKYKSKNILNELYHKEPNCPNPNHAVVWAVLSFQEIEEIKFLMEQTDKKDVENAAAIALVYAAASGRHDVVNYLSNFVHSSSLPRLEEALRAASKRGYAEVVELLLNLDDERKPTAEMWREAFDSAMEANQGLVVSIFAEKFNLKDKALEIAAKKGKGDVIKHLLNPEQILLSVLKKSLQLAVDYNQLEIVKYYLCLIDEKRIPSSLLDDLLQYAIAQNNRGVLNLLAQRELDRAFTNIMNLKVEFEQIATSEDIDLHRDSLLEKVEALYTTNEILTALNLIDLELDLEYIHSTESESELTLESNPSGFFEAVLFKRFEIKEKARRYLHEKGFQPTDVQVVHDTLNKSSPGRQFVKDKFEIEQSESHPTIQIQQRALEALGPIRKKIEETVFTGKNGKTSALLMIEGLEGAINEYFQDNDYGKFKVCFDRTIESAKTTLDSQVGWRKVIDDVANAVLSIFTNRNNPFSFFKNPNPLNEEIKQVKAVIQSNLDSVDRNWVEIEENQDDTDVSTRWVNV